ncbi:hypothetical protein NUW54_g7375 [Trametes sanguinea]|uniref:Uncharacterized protein n=1 Tax=Trametes sanguinea TaxID=158606 RepID=A0ACC1PMN8_9APHY|nr:hypothetical protein NUW54_g7375 [Trametes sanguinea]
MVPPLPPIPEDPAVEEPSAPGSPKSSENSAPSSPKTPPHSHRPMSIVLSPGQVSVGSRMSVDPLEIPEAPEEAEAAEQPSDLYDVFIGHPDHLGLSDQPAPQVSYLHVLSYRCSRLPRPTAMSKTSTGTLVSSISEAVRGGARSSRRSE